MLKTAYQTEGTSTQAIKRKQTEKKEDPTLGMGNSSFSSFFNNSTISTPNEPSELEAVSTAKEVTSINRSTSEDFMGDMENSFGMDFSNVNFHNNSESHKLSRSIQADAFTKGNDIYFAENRYNPGTNDGQELIAHELTHVAQQNSGGEVQRKAASPNVSAHALPSASIQLSPTTAAPTVAQPAPTPVSTPVPEPPTVSPDVCKQQKEHLKDSTNTLSNLFTPDLQGLTVSGEIPKNLSELSGVALQKIIDNNIKAGKLKNIIAQKDVLKKEKATLSENLNKLPRAATSSSTATNTPAVDPHQALKDEIKAVLETTNTLINRIESNSLQGFVTKYGNSDNIKSVTDARNQKIGLPEDMLKTIQKPIFKKFIEIVKELKSSGILNGIDAFINNAENKALIQKEGSTDIWGEVNDAADTFVGGGLGFAGDVMGYEGDRQAKAQNATEDTQLQTDASKVGQTSSVIGSVISISSLAHDSVEMNKNQREKGTQMAALGLDGKKSSHADNTRIAADTVGVVGSGLGIASAFTENDKTSDGLGVGSGISTVLGDVLNLSASGADLQKQKNHNEKSVKLIQKYVDQAKSKNSDKVADLKNNLNAIPTSDRAMSKKATAPTALNAFDEKSSNILTGYRTPTKAPATATAEEKEKWQLEGTSVSALEKAQLINKTRNVSQNNASSQGKDIAFDTIAGLLDVGNLVGSSMSLAGLDSGGLVSTIFSTIGTILKMGKYVYDKASDHKSAATQAEENNESAGLMQSIMGNVNELPINLNPSDTDINQLVNTTTDEAKNTALNEYYSAYIMMKSANINLIGFLYNAQELKNANADANPTTRAEKVKQAKISMLAELHKGISE